MLVLQRKVDEEIVIILPDGQEISLRVVAVRLGNNKVRLGVKAGENIKVHRREVWESIQREELESKGD